MGFVFNGIAKTITLTPGTVVLGVKDIYSRWKDWAVSSDNLKFQKAFDAVGGEDIDLSAGTKIPPFVFLTNGWRIKPQEAHHTLNVQDGILLVQGGGDPFINTTGSYVVRINYQQPVQAIGFNTAGGGGGSGPSASVIAQAVWDELKTSHTTPESFGKLVGGIDLLLKDLRNLILASGD